MSSLAYIYADIACERCGQYWHDHVAVAWGLCGGWDLIHYRPGDVFEWRSDFDAAAPADTVFRPYTAHSGTTEMVNHGDPLILDLWLTDGRSDLAGQDCGGCGQTSIPIVEVKHGAIESVAAVAVTDRRAIAAIAIEDAPLRPYSTATWRHGVTEHALGGVKAFLEDFELHPTTQYYSLEHDDLAGLRRHHDEIGRALMTGVRQFSSRLVFHATAAQVGSDPHLLKHRLDQLLLQAD